MHEDPGSSFVGPGQPYLPLRVKWTLFFVIKAMRRTRWKARYPGLIYRARLFQGCRHDSNISATHPVSALGSSKYDFI